MALVAELEKRKIIIVPHGSFVAYLSLDEHKKMTIPYFGNKAVLDWEASRELQREWLTRAGLKLPRQFRSGAEIDRPVIVKLYGAAGGKGYMFIRDAHDFEARAAHLKEAYTIQEYIIGVPLYIHYFYSPLQRKLEIMSMDRRYETNVDSLGRIPAAAQEGMDVEPVLRRRRQPAGLAARVDAGRSATHGRRRGARQPGDLRAEGTLRRVLHRDDHHARHAVLRHGDLGAHRRGNEPLHRRFAVLVSELLRADVDRAPHRAGDQERAADQQSPPGAWMIRACCSAALAVALRRRRAACPIAGARDRSRSIRPCSTQQMKDAYAKGAARGWDFRAEATYLSTIFNAGRAYSLQYPNDPAYGELATLTVQHRYRPALQSADESRRRGLVGARGRGLGR